MYKKGGFGTYLSSFKVDKGCEFTHTSIFKPSGAFYVSPEQEDEFLEKYIVALQHGEELHMTEKHRSLGPIVIDLDFRFPNEQKKGKDPVRMYKTEHIQQIVSTYATIISQFFDAEEFPTFYVMEKPRPTACKDLIKDGLHIIVPNVVSRPCVQLLLRKKVIPLLAPILNDMGVINVVEDVVDEAVISRNNWQMYGSCKPDCDPYKVTKVFVLATDHVNDITQECNIDDLNTLVPLLSIRNKFDETPLKIDIAEQVIQYEQNMLMERKKKMDLKLTRVNNKANTSEEVDLVRKLVMILSPQRADKYEDWIRLGWCLRNIDYRLLDTWIEFSKKSSKFEEGTCEKFWNLMKDDGLGIGSLYMWVRQDNPKEFEKIMENDLSSLIYESASKSHHDIAKVVHFMYKHDFVCASVKHNIWYQFKDHRWRLCDNGHALRTLLSTHVAKKYLAEDSKLKMRAANEDDVEKRDSLTKKGGKMSEISLKLKDTNFKDNIMKECREMFFHEKFEEKLDSRCNLIGFENGVFDLESLEFREGHPEDFISLSTTTNYMEYDHNIPQAQEMHSFINKVLTNPELREYVLRVLSSFLNGSIREERFHIWTGSGANGKSKIIELFESAFGEYCIKFPITLLTGKRAASNAATSEIARSKGKRFACLQEPSEDEKLNVGLMKELSGGDKIQARALFKEPIEFKPQFKMILTCNNLPNVPSDDGGTWRRIRVVEFTSKFVEKPNPNNLNEFQMDTSISSRFDEWKEHFMSLLIEKYKEYIKVGGTIHEPEEVMRCTREYQRNNDSYAEFVAQKIMKSDMDSITVPQVYESFKSWVRDNAPHIKLAAPLMRDNLKKHLGNVTNIRGTPTWKGYALIDNMILENDDTDI